MDIARGNRGIQRRQLLALVLVAGEWITGDFRCELAPPPQLLAEVTALFAQSGGDVGYVASRVAR